MFTAMSKGLHYFSQHKLLNREWNLGGRRIYSLRSSAGQFDISSEVILEDMTLNPFVHPLYGLFKDYYNNTKEWYTIWSRFIKSETERLKGACHFTDWSK